MNSGNTYIFVYFCRMSHIPLHVSIFILFIFRGDLYEDDTIQDLLKYKPPWVEEFDKICSGTPVETAGLFVFFYADYYLFYAPTEKVGGI